VRLVAAAIPPAKAEAFRRLAGSGVAGGCDCDDNLFCTRDECVETDDGTSAVLSVAFDGAFALGNTTYGSNGNQGIAFIKLKLDKP